MIFCVAWCSTCSMNMVIIKLDCVCFNQPLQRRESIPGGVQRAHWCVGSKQVMLESVG